MYIPEFVCGMAFVIFVELIFAIACSIHISSKEKEKENEETDNTNK